MSVEVNKPKTIIRRDSSIVVNWENVFPALQQEEIFILQMYDEISGWKTIHWGKKTKCTINDLSPNNWYQLRLGIKSSNGECNWIEFKTATDTEQCYVKHLTRAIKFSKVPLIRKIIAKRPQLLEIESRKNRTPLMQATENDDLALITFLINSGAKVNGQCLILGRTALMMALLKGFISAANYLIDKGARIDLKDVNGMSSLHYAVDSNCYESVQFALNKGADVKWKDNKGWNALLRAVVMESSDEIIELLLACDSDPLEKDKKGYNFLEHIALCNRMHLKQYVKKECETIIN